MSLRQNKFPRLRQGNYQSTIFARFYGND